MDSDEVYLRLALAECQRGIAAGQSPFGACIVRDGAVLAVEHNRVWASCDPTAHAEVQAIRAACARTAAVHLAGSVIFSTTEPCPMCFAAIHWARIGRVVSAATIADAASFGFNELEVDNPTLKRLGGLAVELVPGVLRESAIELFRQWRDGGGARAY